MASNIIKTTELLTNTNSALLPIGRIANSVCLLAWTIEGYHEEEQAYGTAFLGSLPKENDYEVVLFSAGHNFPGFCEGEDYAFEKYNIFFNNIDGITNKKTLDEMKKEMGGVKLWNLAKFLSKFDAEILHNVDDFMAIRLGITKTLFEKKTSLKCLPICTQVNLDNPILTVYGHPSNEPLAETLPLSLSYGTMENDNNVKKMLEAKISENNNITGVPKK